MYAKDPYESKYQYVIKKCEEVGRKHFEDPKAFIEYSNEICKMFRTVLKKTFQERKEKS